MMYGRPLEFSWVGRVLGKGEGRVYMLSYRYDTCIHCLSDVLRGYCSP